MCQHIESQITDTLGHFTVDGLSVTPPNRDEMEIAADDYAKLKEILCRLGGKWGRGKFTFPSNPQPLIDAVCETQIMPEKNPLAFFPTSDETIDDIFEETEIASYIEVMGQERLHSGDEPLQVLEPSAGQGRIAMRLRAIEGNHSIDTVELNEINQQVLRDNGFDPFCGSFLDFNTDAAVKYDVIVMNPPFSVKGDKLAYITHIMHAISMLKDDGRLIAIAPTGFITNNSAREQEFLDLIACNLDGQVIMLPENSFKDAGTNVNTCYVTYENTTNTNWKLQPHQEYANYFAFTFMMMVENSCKLDDKARRLVNDPKADIDAFMEEVIGECISVGDLIPRQFKPLYLRELKDRYLAPEEVIETEAACESVTAPVPVIESVTTPEPVVERVDFDSKVNGLLSEISELLPKPMPVADDEGQFDLFEVEEVANIA